MGVRAEWSGFACFIYTYLRHLRDGSYFIGHFSARPRVPVLLWRGFGGVIVVDCA
mgnify:CR=1 FL=1